MNYTLEQAHTIKRAIRFMNANDGLFMKHAQLKEQLLKEAMKLEEGRKCQRSQVKAPKGYLKKLQQSINEANLKGTGKHKSVEKKAAFEKLKALVKAIKKPKADKKLNEKIKSLRRLIAKK
jgi:hypothetical protein